MYKRHKNVNLRRLETPIQIELAIIVYLSSANKPETERMLFDLLT